MISIINLLLTEFDELCGVEKCSKLLLKCIVCNEGQRHLRCMKISWLTGITLCIYQQSYHELIIMSSLAFTFFSVLLCFKVGLLALRWLTTDLLILIWIRSISDITAPSWSAAKNSSKISTELTSLEEPGMSWISLDCSIQAIRGGWFQLGQNTALVQCITVPEPDLGFWFDNTDLMKQFEMVLMFWGQFSTSRRHLSYVTDWISWLASALCWWRFNNCMWYYMTDNTHCSTLKFSFYLYFLINNYTDPSMQKKTVKQLPFSVSLFLHI